MPRPKGSKNKPKEGQAPKAAKQSPSAGHNSELTEAERTSLLVQGLGKIETLKTEQEGLVGKIRNENKRLQASGFTAANIKFALDLRKKKHEESQEEWESNRAIARMLNHPIGAPDLFEGADEDARIKRAGAEGELSGASGEKCDPMPKYSPTSPEGQEWIKRWHIGQAAHAATIGRGNNVTLIRPPAVEKKPDAFADALDTAGDEKKAPPAGAEDQQANGAQPEEQAGGETAQPPSKKDRKFAAAGDAFLAEQIAKQKADTA